MTKFRKGDVCTIEVVVDSNSFGDGDIRVRQPDKYSDIYVKQSSLTMLRPSFEVDDTVNWSNGENCFTGTVLSIANDHLWVDLGAGNFGTVWIGKAMRVDPESAAEAEVAAA